MTRRAACGQGAGKELVVVVFSRQVTADVSQPQGLQHTRLPCPHRLLGFAQVHVV